MALADFLGNSNNLEKLGTFLQYAGGTAMGQNASPILASYLAQQKDQKAREEAQGVLQQYLGGGGAAMSAMGGAQAAPAGASGSAPVDFGQYEASFGLPSGYLARTAQIESRMGANMNNPNSSAAGPFQFISSTAQQYDLTDPYDWSQSTQAASRLAADNKQALIRALGREPTGAELYLAHQQGAGGASKLLANPNARAVDIVGEDAVRLNGGDANMTAGQFANKWLSKFGGQPAQQAPQMDPQRAAQILMNPQIPDAVKAQVLQRFGPQSPQKMEIVKLADGRSYYVDPLGVQPPRLVNPDVQPVSEPSSTIGKLQADLASGNITQDQYDLAVSSIGKPVAEVNMPAGETAFQKKTGEVMAQEAADIVAQGAVAQRNLGSLQNLSTALANAPQGAAGALANFATNLGIKTEGSSDIEVANALINQLVPQQRPPGSGQMSDRDVQLFKESLPRVINTPGGNAKIIDTMQSVLEYDVERMKIARALQLGQISPEEAFLRYDALGNPLADFAEGAQPAPAAPTVGVVEDGYRYIGGDPSKQTSWEAVE